MRLGFKRGEKGFTLIEIIIVLAVMAVLAAVVVPSVSGFLGRSKERAWDADRNTIQAAVDSYRTDIKKRVGNPWPVSDNKTIGVPTDNNTDGDYIDVADLKKGIIDIKKLSDDGYIKGADAVKSANVAAAHTTATNSPSGSYVWYIDSTGVVHSLYRDTSTWQTDFQTDIYP